MDYIIKNRLQNKYPSILNYNTDDGGYIYLDGAFSRQNYVAWKKPKISQLKYTPNTSFRFIVEFTTSENDKYSKFYTSEAYYKDLVSSQKDNNPYFSKASFRKNSIITINISQLITQRLEMDSTEGLIGVRTTKNVLFDTNFSNTENIYGINYDALVEYIDWLLTQDKIYNPKTGGVIDAQQLGVWNTGIWNRITNTYQSEEEYNFFIYKKTLEDQLKGIDDVITSLNYLYQNPDCDVAFTLVDRAISSFKITGTLALAGGAYVSVAALQAAAAGATIAAALSGAPVAAIKPLMAIGSALGPIGWAAAAAIRLATAILTFFGKKSDDKQREEKIKAIKKYCLEEIDKFKRLRETTVADLNNAKKLEPAARQPIVIVNSDTLLLKQTAFEYDDEKFQTKNERRIYSANIKRPIIYSVVPGTKGVIGKKTDLEPDIINVKPDWGDITTN